MKIFRLLLTLLHLGILILLLATPLNSLISPQRFPFLNLLSLTFAPLMIVNLVAILFWIILWKKRALFFIACSLLLFNPTKRWINWTSKSEEVPNLKIVSFNIKGGQMGRDKIYDYLENSGADIILGQEYGGEFNIPNYKHRTNEEALVATNSKYEILKIQNIKTNGIGSAIYTDIKINDKIIRIFNIYLNPFSFDKQKLKPSEELNKNKTKVKYAAKKLLPIFKIHQQEIVDIRKAIDESPYPVIVAGDFNAVPNSYEYYELGNGLKDVFFEIGNGNGTSFYDYKFPIRIDYIFSSKELIPVSYKVDRSIKLSDHYPVIAEFKVK